MVALVLAVAAPVAAQARSSSVTAVHETAAAHQSRLSSPAVIGDGRMPAPAASQPGSTLRSHQSDQTVAGYWLVASDGGVFSFGGAGFYGSTGSMTLNKPIVGMAGTPDSRGYWLVASDGGVFTFGDAVFYGSTGNMTLNEPVVGMAATPDGRGYWLVASDGGIFCFGDAPFYGSTGSMTLNQPVVGMAATPDGRGYWLVASDGGIFAFGDAGFHGSTGSMVLNQPIVGMAAATDGGGYLLVAADGGVFAFGDVNFYGSLGNEPLSRPIVAAATTPTDDGYWFTDDNGAVSAFGQAEYFGSAPQVLNDPIVGMAEAAGTGAFSVDAYPSGSYGYDVSNFQCGQTLPTGHTIGIVQVLGASFASVNPCLTTEAQWAGAGLNLYIFLTYGTQATGPGVCGGDTSCNYGFADAQYAYQQAQAAGVDTQVTWWLDVEDPPPPLAQWSSDLSENAQMIAGAISGLRSEGINNVGVYASPGVWNTIAGGYQPPVPYWMADWLSPPSGPDSCADGANQEELNQLPTGPIVMVQYGVLSIPEGQFDGDYAC